MYLLNRYRKIIRNYFKIVVTFGKPSLLLVVKTI